LKCMFAVATVRRGASWKWFYSLNIIGIMLFLYRIGLFFVRPRKFSGRCRPTS
jgi:hypothetical protein